MIISYPASRSRIIVLLKTLRPRIENLNQKQMKERNVEKEKTVKWKHLLITWLNEKGAKTLDVLQRFWEVSEMNAGASFSENCSILWAQDCYKWSVFL